LAKAAVTLRHVSHRALSFASAFLRASVLLRALLGVLELAAAALWQSTWDVVAV
jgi:hypothetical protein